jgi:hypothetical protein
MDDWFAGFRHGASVARETGLRERVLVPIALPPRKSVETGTPTEHFPPAPSPVPPAAPLPSQAMQGRS